MKKLNVALENCYGIRSLRQEFDFSECSTYAIYAPNGVMKTSFAKTFRDAAADRESVDRISPDRISKRQIFDQENNAIPQKNILVISPYDEEFGLTKETSTLLVDPGLRKEWEDLHNDLKKMQQVFLKELKKKAGSRVDFEKEISYSITQSEDKFYDALIRVEKEVAEQDSAPFSEIRYDKVFDQKILEFLATEDFKNAIQDYVEKYNVLLDDSTYFNRATFNYYNAETIAKSLAANGFFEARHSVNLKADETREITNKEELEKLIAEEKEKIASDGELRKKYEKIDSQLSKNQDLRNFRDYLSEHKALLPKLANIAELKQDIWKSYFKENIALYSQLIEQFNKTKERAEEIAKEAKKQRTQWQLVIEMFNDRFFVPFRLSAENKIAVMLGDEPLLRLGFKFKNEEDGKETPVDKDTLMQVLSTGERKALYILNIIFEVEVRRKAKQETLFIFDDIADSFDYKNKYAIIQYLMDIDEDPLFQQILLTHNFDFFRTVNSRFVGYPQCLMAAKTTSGLSIKKAKGIKNPFVNDWRKDFFTNSKKRIASIPFLRNLIEYTEGIDNRNYNTLTLLLHWKSDSNTVTQENLDDIYNQIFGENGASTDRQKPVISIIGEAAQACMNGGDGISIENKVVLSIAIRLTAERFMVEEINNEEFVNSIQVNQTQELFKRFKQDFDDRVDAIEIIQRVILMTPENIHLNSFMYEPIVDMSDEHLKKLYQNVLELAS